MKKISHANIIFLRIIACAAFVIFSSFMSSAQQFLDPDNPLLTVGSEGYTRIVNGGLDHTPLGLGVSFDPLWRTTGRTDLTEYISKIDHKKHDRFTFTKAQAQSVKWDAEVSFDNYDMTKSAAWSLSQSGSFMSGVTELFGEDINIHRTTTETSQTAHLYIHIMGTVTYSPAQANRIEGTSISRDTLRRNGTFYVSGQYLTAGVAIQIDLGEASGILDTALNGDADVRGQLPLGDSGLSIKGKNSGMLMEALKQGAYSFSGRSSTFKWGVNCLPPALLTALSDFFPEGQNIDSAKVAQGLTKVITALDFDPSSKNVPGDVYAVELTPTLTLADRIPADDQFDYMMRSYSTGKLIQLIIRSLWKKDLDADYFWPQSIKDNVHRFAGSVVENLADIEAALKNVYTQRPNQQIQKRGKAASDSINEQYKNMGQILPFVSLKWVIVDEHARPIDSSRPYDERSMRNVLTVSLKNCTFKHCRLVIPRSSDYNHWNNQATTDAIRNYESRTNFPNVLPPLTRLDDGSFLLDSSLNLNITGFASFV